MITIKAKTADEAIIAQADQNQGVIELEGNWYFDRDRVNMSNLVITDRTYVCPYKGTCYWLDFVSDEVNAKNIGWVYEEPMTGYESIKGRIAFYARETSATISDKTD